MNNNRPRSLIEKALIVVLGVPLALWVGSMVVGRLLGYSTYDIGFAIASLVFALFPYLLLVAFVVVVVCAMLAWDTIRDKFRS